jgi:hypothetical protein
VGKRFIHFKKIKNMKKLIVVLVVALMSQSMIAQADTAVVVPQAVASAFATRFPTGQLQKWAQRPQGYIAAFKQDGKKYFAYYAADGTWKGTETPVKWTKNLPADVRKGWIKSGYGTWYVEDIKKIDQPDQPLYVLHVDNSPLLDADHKDAFMEEWVLFFNSNGDLVNKYQLDQNHAGTEGLGQWR